MNSFSVENRDRRYRSHAAWAGVSNNVIKRLRTFERETLESVLGFSLDRGVRRLSLPRVVGAGPARKANWGPRN
jgi:hypothetical protein